MVVNQENILLNKSRQFALDIISLYLKLQEEREYVLSKQILRSGTSVGANVYEAVVSQSKKDFLSKISIALKEAHETVFWLGLFRDSAITTLNVDILEAQCMELVKMLLATKKTTEKNLGQ
jgi:four helix bundle protein